MKILIKIPIEKELPEESGCYLVMDKNGNTIFDIFYSIDEEFKEQDITHWYKEVGLCDLLESFSEYSDKNWIFSENNKELINKFLTENNL